MHTPTAFGNTGLSPQIARLDWFRAVRQLLRDMAPDVVHFTGPHLWNGLLINGLRQRGVRVIHTIHDLDPHVGRPLGRLLGLWNRSIIQTADIILTHGRQYEARLRQEGRAARVAYLPLLHLFFSYQQGAALPPNGPPQTNREAEPLVLFLGRLELYKGVAHLLAAFSQLPPPARDGACLILAGRGTLPAVWRDSLPAGVELRNRLIEDAEGLELIQRCRVLVLPYLGATQSALPAAAYFFNKPVIVTHSGALPEYVENGRTGLIVPPGDTPALADALAYALTHPAEMAQMGRAGRAWYETERRQETADLARLYGAA